jgi:hypothetical protein
MKLKKAAMSNAAFFESNARAAGWLRVNHHPHPPPPVQTGAIHPRGGGDLRQRTLGHPPQNLFRVLFLSNSAFA